MSDHKIVFIVIKILLDCIQIQLRIFVYVCHDVETKHSNMI